MDICETSDEDNVENLNREISRRVSQFFTHSTTMDNGNESTIDNHLLFNIMEARRSCISINDKDEVTVLSRVGKSDFAADINYKISNCNNNNDGDDSWTDEEGEESDCGNYSLRRKR